MVMTAEPNKPMPWYRVPLVWLGIAVVTLSLGACIHLVVLSLSLPGASGEAGAGQSAEFRGVPLNEVSQPSAEAEVE